MRQYILRDFLEEPAQLGALRDDILKTACILTYNGRVFDLPLLRSRYRINRMEIPFDRHPHLDFMYPSRRLYKRHFGSFNLTLLEAMLVGFERTDDVPPHIIPRIYFDYLQCRDEDLLLPILNHNRDDIVSLYLLTQETCRRVDLALSDGSGDDLLFLSLGQLLFKAEDYEQSRAMLERIKPRFAPQEVVDESLMLRSRLAKKTHDWQTARNIWRRMLRSGRFGCYPHVELAKHLEHRLKNPKAALELTDMALHNIESEREFISTAVYTYLLAGLKRRRQRLIRKMAL